MIYISKHDIKRQEIEAKRRNTRKNNRFLKSKDRVNNAGDFDKKMIFNCLIIKTKLKKVMLIL